MLRTVLLASVLLLAACATGAPQAVTLTSLPPGAACAVDRAGEHLGVVTLTPGSLPLYTTGGSLEVTCSLPGYRTAVVVQPAEATGGGGYRYPPVIQVALPSLSGGAPGYGYVAVRSTTTTSRYARRGRRAYASGYGAAPRRTVRSVAYRGGSYRSRTYRRTTYRGGAYPAASPEQYRTSPFVLRDPVASHTARY